MTKQITKQINEQDWYKSLIEDCSAVLTEGIFNYRLTLIKTYHLLGKRILEENSNFKRAEIYGQEITKRVSESMGKSQRTIEKSVQFVKLFPDLDIIPEGKNITWNKICNDLLPKHKKELPEGKETALRDRIKQEIESNSCRANQLEGEEMVILSYKAIEILCKKNHPDSLKVHI